MESGHVDVGPTTLVTQMCAGVELKKKRGWPKGKPRGKKKQKVESMSVIPPTHSPGNSAPIIQPIGLGLGHSIGESAKKIHSNPSKPSNQSSVQLSTPPKNVEKVRSEIEPTKPKEARSNLSPVETVRTLRYFIAKRMHFMYRFKVKLEEIQDDGQTQIDHACATAALETMETFLLKNLNRIREYKTVLERN